LLVHDVLPVVGLPSEAEPKRKRAEELKRRLGELRTEARLNLGELPPPRKQEYEEAESEFGRVCHDLLDANPVYRRGVGQPLSPQSLADLRRRAIGPKRLLLVYHIGREHSYLLLLGDRPGTAEAYPLVFPTELPQDGELPAGWREQETVPLTDSLLRRQVNDYLRWMTDPNFTPTRGIKIKATGGRWRPEVLAEVLLPPLARACIRSRAPESLVLIPDGPLHRLPFESLLLKGGQRPTYVLDELPPLVYFPSLAVLERTSRDRAAGPAAPLSLLTVANPSIPQLKLVPEGGPAIQRRAFREAEQLPFITEESRRIAALFEQGQFGVTSLLGPAATKKAVVAALAGKRVVHVATHCPTENLSRNFAALALTPPAKKSPEEDALLTLHEAYTLPLGDCELAVLSACRTTEGPSEAVESGVTLSNAFLAAGARRVVASQWDVDDPATAELMVAFFAEVTASARKGEPVSYARALQLARRKVRGQDKWSAPYYWGPFVLLGPAD
jgi:CHAT domain-containing protein